MEHPSASAAPTARRNYPMNCWWVAALASEVGRKPLSRQLLELPVVLFRKLSGEVVALDERCPHRWAPLSAGNLSGDDLVCPYHGATFSPDGRCTKFQALGKAPIPSVMRVRAYAVVERGPFIWIWLGDDEARQAAPLPPGFEWASDPSWTSTCGGYSFNANYMLLHENVMDLTHFNYVHANSFGVTDYPPSTAERVGDRVTYTLKARRDEVEGPRRRFVGLEDPAHDSSVMVGAFETPAWHSWVCKTYDRAGEYTGERTNINHMVTPSSPTHTHYWWLIGANPRLPSLWEVGFSRLNEMAFQEDKVMIESIQHMIERDRRGRDHIELSIPSDAGGVLSRRVVDSLIQKERPRT